MSYVLKILLSPFTVLYGAVVIIRNALYNAGYFKSTSFNTKTIVVGNLRAGGAGKTPLIEYLVKLLQLYSMPVATLSRGYKRRTKGFLLADNNTTATEIGDEPMQIKQKFPGAYVSVCEKRVEGMQQLEKLPAPPGVVLLDDAFQHRALKAGLYILVTEYNRLFTDDWLIPSGRLREPRNAYKRAHIIVVSKCPGELSEQQQKEIEKRINPLPYHVLVFARYQYGPFEDIITQKPVEINADTAVLLLTGIADNTRMKIFIEQRYKKMSILAFADHHTYDSDDIARIIDLYKQMPGTAKQVITTEKDAVKLKHYSSLFEKENINIAIQPMYVEFINDDKTIFDAAIFKYLNDGEPTR